MFSDYLMRFVTNFGDEAVIIPLILVTTILFAAIDWWKGAFVWCGGVFFTVLLIVIAKMFGLLWGEWYGVYGRAFSLSGHVAASTVVYGTLAHIFIFGRFRSWGRAILPPLLIACLMSYTRLQLMAHTLTEVVSGTCLGVLSATAIERCMPEAPSGLRRVSIPVLLTIMLIFHGYVLQAEPALQSFFHVSYFSINQVIGW